ncbi:hypothetical protein H5410_049745 [Solanum commersonii]|uniref:Uncharacterized protein n=1 Tax=Solanum commersonii TaxID=4109 RepID=A0A9J5WVY9_SOLCO|nr:hypothetical protein H5410_049745 [Solanum commersonii]
MRIKKVIPHIIMWELWKRRNAKRRCAYIYIEGNQLADCITNITINHEDKQQYASFYELPIKASKILNMDKQQIPTIRIRTRRITNTSNHQHEGNGRGKLAMRIQMNSQQRIMCSPVQSENHETGSAKKP